MTELVTIICPECGFRKNVPKGAIPEGAARANCPRCKHSFVLNSETLVACPTHAAEPAAPPSPPLPVDLPPESAAPHRLNFCFSGSARDYFGIWVVNTLLKLATLGIYSAWPRYANAASFTAARPCTINRSNTWQIRWHSSRAG